MYMCEPLYVCLFLLIVSYCMYYNYVTDVISVPMEEVL